MRENTTESVDSPSISKHTQERQFDERWNGRFSDDDELTTYYPIPIESSAIVRVLGVLIVMLVLAHITGSVFRFVLGHDYVYGLVPLFDLDEEVNIPTYFASFLLLIAAALLGLVASSKKRDGDSHATHWVALATIFLYISIDESAGIHELLIIPVRNAFDLSSFLYFAWIIPGFMFVSVLAWSYRRFLWQLPSQTRRLFLLSALCYLAGALGVEALGGYYISHPDVGLDTILYTWIILTEETLEMVGVLIFIDALFKYLRDHVSGVAIAFR